MLSRAIGVTWPIIVLKAKLVMVAMLTPFERVLVSNISAGTIHESGPFVAEKEKLYIHVMTMKPQPAALFPDVPGGNFANSIVAMINVMQFPIFPPIMAKHIDGDQQVSLCVLQEEEYVPHLRPVQSMNRMQHNCARSAIIEEMPCNCKVLLRPKPI